MDISQSFPIDFNENITLADQVAYLQNIITLMPGNVYWKNRQGFYLGCNQNVAQLLKFNSCQEIIGKTIYDLFDKKYADIIHKTDEEIMTSAKELILEEPGPDMHGNFITYLTRKIPLFDQNKKVIGLLGVSFDISDRKKMEAELKNAKEIAEQQSKLAHIYLKNILVSLPENFYWVDKDSRILGCNDNQARIFGLLNAQKLIGKTIYGVAEMLGWDKTFADMIRKNDLEVMLTKKTKKVEESPIIDGEKRTFLSYKNPLLDDTNNAIGVFGVSVDITERKKMEEELLAAKEKAELANRAKSEFIMNMSHDLRTPFSGILGFAKILQKKEIDEDKKEVLNYVVQSGERLLTLLNEILDLVKFAKDDLVTLPAKFSIQNVVQQVAELMMAEIKYKNLELKLNVASNIPFFIIGDKLGVHRILLNLLGNAVKFTARGYVRINVEIFKKEKNKVVLKILVEDTGIGIPEDKYQIIFERFSRLTASYEGHYPGSGVGLYMVKQFVEEMNGQIRVSSEIGKGTTFTCLLPFQVSEEFDADQERDTAVVVSGDVAKNVLAQKPKHILLVEDDAIAQKMAKIILQEYFSCEVEIAATGSQALALVANKRFDLILTDIGLPDMDGFTLTKKIRQLGFNLPIIGLTAHADQESRSSAQESNMNEVVVKPLSEEICLRIFSFMKGDN